MALTGVLDACAMLAFLRRERGGEEVAKILYDPASICFAHAINHCEVHHSFMREDSRAAAEDVVVSPERLGVRERLDMVGEFWRRVATIKAGGKVSLAGCVCLALAEKLSAVAVTSDRAEFGRLGSRVACQIEYIR